MNHIADKFDVAESSVQNSLNRLLDFLFSIPEERKEDFNRLHRQQRVTIEGAFGLLKNPFQRLFYVNAPSIKQAVLIIIGACVLHNLCIYAPVTMTTPSCSQQGWMFLFLTKTATFSPVWETSRTK
ncbi:hypothetical protein HPB48_011912 [Haemaphysalis longicornis]|uniref:DDE Tnp4 domain-containing protein n=1 Tax=Haemaphysalis longicornis TaxID=44386 RepID=A0A9J6GUW0_HAELO|nr:hypothetical protein HPB48_011912 [Haemaphysalis longicornis]